MAADWDAAENGARSLHGADFVDSIGTARSASSPGVDKACEVPEPVLDALVELAWSFPGLRVSYAGLTERRTLKFLACAGADHLTELNGWHLDISRQRKFYDALRTADIPIMIEDAATDGRTRPLAEAFAEQHARSMVIFPLRHERQEPTGLVMLDSDKARTWSAKEAAALERVGPLVLLGLDHARTCMELEHARAKAAEYERRLAGASGLAAGVIHDTSLLVGGLMNIMASGSTQQAGESAATLGRQLEAVLSELAALNQGHTKTREPHPLNLNAIIDEIMPGLRVLVGRNVRMLTQLHPEKLLISGHRPGVERMLVNVLVHAQKQRSRDTSVVVETDVADGLASITLYGDGLELNDALALLDNSSGFATVDDLGMGLWQVRTEALLHGATIRVRTEHNGQARIRISFPLIA